jgi:hypothetical protein
MTRNTQAAARKLSEAVTAAVVQSLSVKDKQEGFRGFMARLPLIRVDLHTAGLASTEPV